MFGLFKREEPAVSMPETHRIVPPSIKPLNESLYDGFMTSEEYEAIYMGEKIPSRLLSDPFSDESLRSETYDKLTQADS